jgi:amidase
MNQDLWRLSATDTARRIRNGELSAEAGTRSVLARIDEVNPRIKALAWVNARCTVCR